MAIEPAKLKFLVVDDFSTMRRIVRNLLKELGFANAEEAEDGAIALQKLRAGKFEFVVTDWNMPNMDGLELIRNLRADPKYKFTPILMLTTEGDANKKQQGKDAGATGWIVKPFNPEKLIQVVNKVAA